MSRDRDVTTEVRRIVYYIKTKNMKKILKKPDSITPHFGVNITDIYSNSAVHHPKSEVRSNGQQDNFLTF